MFLPLPLTRDRTGPRGKTGAQVTQTIRLMHTEHQLGMIPQLPGEVTRLLRLPAPACGFHQHSETSMEGRVFAPEVVLLNFRENPETVTLMLLT